MRGVAITAWGAWTAGGVSVCGAPREHRPGLLGPWAEAPALSAIHPRLRRPPRAAASLVQLAHAVLAQRGDALAREDVAVMLGSRAGSAASDGEFFRSTRQRGMAFGSPGAFVYTLPSSAPAELSIALGVKGPLWTLSAGGATGLSALVTACEEVAAGRVDACLAGQAEVGDPQGEWIALFLLEGGERAARQLTGFDYGALGGKAAATGAAPGVLALAHALGAATAGDAPFEEADARGAWAKVTLHQ